MNSSMKIFFFLIFVFPLIKGFNFQLYQNSTNNSTRNSTNPTSNSTLPFVCPKGFFCRNNTKVVCPGGYYCINETITLCPMGKICRLGSSDAKNCEPFSNLLFPCLEGTEQQNLLPETLGFLTLCFIGTLLASWIILFASNMCFKFLAVFSENIGDSNESILGSTITFDYLTLKVGKKVILNDISGEISPGLTAVILQ